MKQQVSPAIIAVVVIVVLAGLGFFLFRGTQGGSSEDINKVISAGAAGGNAPATAPANVTGPSGSNAGGLPAPGNMPANAPSSVTTPPGR